MLSFLYYGKLTVVERAGRQCGDTSMRRGVLPTGRSCGLEKPFPGDEKNFREPEKLKQKTEDS